MAFAARRALVVRDPLQTSRSERLLGDHGIVCARRSGHNRVVCYFQSEIEELDLHHHSLSTKLSTLNHSRRLNVVQCTFHQSFEARSKTKSLMAEWKRLQLACTIMISVSHLYMTVSKPEDLESNVLYFPAPAANTTCTKQQQHRFPSRRLRRTSPLRRRTPFHYLRQPQLPTRWTSGKTDPQARACFAHRKERALHVWKVGAGPLFPVANAELLSKRKAARSMGYDPATWDGGSVGLTIGLAAWLSIQAICDRFSSRYLGYGIWRLVVSLICGRASCGRASA